MKFYSLANCPVDRGEFEAKVNGRPWLFAGIVFVLIGALVAYLSFRARFPARLFESASAIISGLVGLVIVSIFILLGGAFIYSWKQSGSPDNWVIRAHAGRLFLHLRRYDLKKAARTDLQVVEIAPGEIRAVRAITTRLVLTGIEKRGTRSYQKWKGIEIDVDADHSDQLIKLLQAERTLMTEHGNSPGFSAMPVQWRDGTIRIPWASSSWQLAPSFKQAVAYFKSWQRHVEDVDQRLEFDLKQMQSLPREEQTVQIKRLAEFQPMAAIMLARLLFSCSLADAKTQVASAMESEGQII